MYRQKAKATHAGMTALYRGMGSSACAGKRGATCDAAGAQAVADGERDVVLRADVQDVVPVRVGKVLAVVQQAQLRSTQDSCQQPDTALEALSPCPVDLLLLIVRNRAVKMTVGHAHAHAYASFSCTAAYHHFQASSASWYSAGCKQPSPIFH